LDKKEQEARGRSYSIRSNDWFWIKSEGIDIEDLEFNIG